MKILVLKGTADSDNFDLFLLLWRESKLTPTSSSGPIKNIVGMNKHLKAVNIKRLVALLSAIVVLAIPVSVAAETIISQSYTASASMPSGSIVSLRKGSTTNVESSNLKNVNYILGVIVDSDSSELSLSGDGNNQVHVATSGVEQVLVSDINGAIAVGDPITVSPINGVGMKATDNVKILGVAQDNFPNSTATKQAYKDQKGQQQSTKLGEVPVLVNVSYYYKQPDKTVIPAALQNVANSLAGRKVNSLPIIISVGIFFIALIIVVSIIYSMIHSSIISVGRNPLSQAAVYRNVIQLSALVVLILGVAVGSIYMVLAKL
jgi:hypothetical protein